MHITGIGVVSCSGIDTDGLGRVGGEWGENRALSFALNAARAAMNEAGWSELRADDGLILATTTGQYLMWDRAFLDLAAGRLSRAEFLSRFRRQPFGDLAQNIRSVLGTRRGPQTVIATACTAGTQALALAALWLKGRCSRVLMGGVEVLCPLTVEGFRSLQLLSPAPARPFDRGRRGINLSEGAGFLCLERETGRSFARISGFGFSSDGHHMTSPAPDGSGSRRAMELALQTAGLQATDVDWVHAHGTGSLHNDLAEGRALSTLVPGVPVSSTKGRHGHALGASGALECVSVVRAMREGVILGTDGFVELDPEIGGLAICRRDERRPVRHVLKNTLGFGGANAAVVLSC